MFVAFLEERVGDGLERVMEFDQETYEVLYGEEALFESTQAYLDSTTYESTTYADVMVTAIGVGYQLFRSDTGA